MSKTKSLFFVLCLVLALSVTANSFKSSSPIWITSNFMRAGFENVITTLTGSDYDPIYTFTFSSALPGVPNLAYGIKQYRGIFSLIFFRY